MPQRTPTCQLGDSTPGDSRHISPHPDDTECPHPTHETEHLIDYSEGNGRGEQLKVTAASQWLHATTGRITTCPHSWMTAVHWVTDRAAKGLYTPSSRHSPKWGPTTVALAQEISALTECRPGIDYLARKVKVSARTVKYHLGMLRETGLLVYRSKGTRLRGEGNRASVYERTIPLAFDVALGIRTTGEGVQRRPVGAAPETRKTLGKLAKKAARKPRRPRRRTRLTGRERCTLMQGGTSRTSTAAGTHSPSESKLASGQQEFTTEKFNNYSQIPNKPGQIPNQIHKRGRKLNKVGRRYRLAAELITRIPWLKGASRPRIAWIVRHVADAGWSALEVQAAAERYVSTREPRRPSAVLAFRLAACHTLYTTPARRRVLVEDWQDSRRAEQARHQDAAYTDLTTEDRHPARASVRQLVAEAFRRNQQIADRQQHGTDEQPLFEIQVDTDPDVLPLEDLDPAFVKRARADAANDLTSITIAINAGLPEREARRLYTNWLVDQALAAQRHTELAPAAF